MLNLIWFIGARDDGWETQQPFSDSVSAHQAEPRGKRIGNTLRCWRLLVRLAVQLANIRRCPCDYEHPVGGGQLTNRRVAMHRRNLTPSPFSTFLWLFSSAASAGSCSWWEKVWAVVIWLLSVEYPTAVMQYDSRSLKGKRLVELVDFKSIQLFLSVWRNICKSSWLVESLVKPEGDFSYIILVMACSGWWDGELTSLRGKACVHWPIFQA